MEPNDKQFDRLDAAREKYGKSFVDRVAKYAAEVNKDDEPDEQDDDRDPKHDHWDA
jgi:hypothetical protein